MSDIDTRFHEHWLGLVQPVEGLVVSVPVLVDAQCLQRQPPEVQQQLLELCPPGKGKDAPRQIADLGEFLSSLLDLTPDLFDPKDALPDELQLYVPEGGQTLRPHRALRHADGASRSPDDRAGGTAGAGVGDESTPASRAGEAYVALVWEIPSHLGLDRPEAVTGPWEYPPSAKFERLLRHVRVPIGLLSNHRVVRLLYAPHGESSGHIDFRIDDMASVGGRPILDAFVMLLHARRFFGVAVEHQLPELLAESRRRQADVTNELARQVFEALEILLQGFEAAAERDGDALLRDALEREDDHLYGGLLTVLLRLVFVLYAEHRGLLPLDQRHYAEHLSLLGLYEQLQQDQGAWPDSMAQRFGAWGRLITLFRAIFLGVRHGDLHLPARHGELFDPHRFPFLEGWGPGGSAPITQYEHRAAVRLPSLDDGSVYRVLEKLLVLQGQRLSYGALDVEQIGSVYEALMGYHVHRLGAAAVCLRPSRVWLSAAECLAQSPARRAAWIQEQTGLAKAQARKVADALIEAKDEEQALQTLEGFAVKKTRRAAAGRLVLQPGSERRRTSSHYTPRSLSQPIVRRTLEPLLAAMGETPSSEALLDLKICDPAMGSGAFLVEACRFLADQVVAAWTREGRLEEAGAAGDDVVMQARRLVAQRCLYGVDKNPFAVQLAKLSLWLVTLSRDRPFSFVDHALRHGDSLVGLSLEQIEAFHWEGKAKARPVIDPRRSVLEEAVDLRQQILDLAANPTPENEREKELLLRDAEDALERLRLVGDVLVGAFFAGKNAREREKERSRRQMLVSEWLQAEGPSPAELLEMRAEIRRQVPVFHWWLEYPEIFQAERPDPLSSEAGTEPADLDAIIGNPPFLGGKRISTEYGDAYSAWLSEIHQSGKNGDLCAHFFRRADALLGEHGTTGLIATNTIGQGDTRIAGLQPLLRQGAVIYDAIRSMTWPGEAAVSVSVVHLAKGTPVQILQDRRLDGEKVQSINSRLRPRPERADPSLLAANAGCSFQGSIVLGMGFTLTPAERGELLARDPRNDKRIFPYIGGEEVNTSPIQVFDRYVIDFGAITLEEAGAWPDLLGIVREKVKPARDSLKRKFYRDVWWQFGEKQMALYSTIAPLSRCLVNSQVTKHLVFSFQPTNRVFGHTLYVYALQPFSSFAILQSRLHEVWARLLSSSLEDRLRYAASDCFENFPFPQPDPRSALPSLEAIGERLYEARARYMVATDQGLTKTYNRLKDADCDEPAIVELRALHEEMDRAVLEAYGWSDIVVPAFTTPRTDPEKAAFERFEDDVLDRLFLLNEERATDERARGLVAGKKKGTRKGKAGAKKKPKTDLTTPLFGADAPREGGAR